MLGSFIQVYLTVAAIGILTCVLLSVCAFLDMRDHTADTFRKKEMSDKLLEAQDRLNIMRAQRMLAPKIQTLPEFEQSRREENE